MYSGNQWGGSFEIAAVEGSTEDDVARTWSWTAARCRCGGSTTSWTRRSRAGCWARRSPGRRTGKSTSALSSSSRPRLCHRRPPSMASSPASSSSASPSSSPNTSRTRGTPRRRPIKERRGAPCSSSTPKNVSRHETLPLLSLIFDPHF
jgi:hypothetical protein